MTPLGRFIRKAVQKAKGTFYEGPKPPDRLGEMVVAFANDNPHATRSEWIDFARFHAAECYRSGYTRGAEWAERDFNSYMSGATPEEIANREEPDWQWSPNILTMGFDDVVLEVNDEEALARQHREAYERAVMERNARSKP